MHIFFSGIGGTAIGPLALIAKQAGHDVSGSDKQQSRYIDYLRQHGIDTIHIGQTAEDIARLHTEKPIDWYVFSSAVSIENPDAPEFLFCRKHNIRMSKRDELLNKIIRDKNLKLLAIAGTHGKTTTTAMLVWLLEQIQEPLSYSLGAKTSFSEMGKFDPASTYFVYECDEFDRNFLAFQPYMALITGIDWDHPDIYPTREAYYAAFRQFIRQCAQTLMWHTDAEQLGLANILGKILNEQDELLHSITLQGLVNRQNALLVASAVGMLTNRPAAELIEHLNRFPGLSRRFEQIAKGLYSDYAHTPPKIRGVLQTAKEAAGDNVVVVYEGLHNTRQHFIRDELRTLFDRVKRLYIVPSYLAREDPALAYLSPDDLLSAMSHETQAHGRACKLDGKLKATIAHHVGDGDLVVCISAGGGGSLDEWVRSEFIP